VSTVNADLQNLMHSTDIGTIFLDRNLTIKRYTRRIEDLFNIISSDLGRPFEHLTHKLDCGDLSKDVATVLKTLQTVEREVRSTTGDASYLARFSPIEPRTIASMAWWFPSWKSPNSSARSMPCGSGNSSCGWRRRQPRPGSGC